MCHFLVQSVHTDGNHRLLIGTTLYHAVFITELT